MKKSYINKKKGVIFILTSLLLSNLALAKTSSNIPSNHIKINWTTLPSNINSNVKSAINNLTEELNNNKHELPKAQLKRLIIKTIENAMAPYGYFSPKIVVSRHIYPHTIQLDAQIDKRKPVKIKNITINIDNKANQWENLARQYPQHTGDTLQTQLFTTYKNQLFQLASKLGYFNAHVTQSVITINRKQHWANIDITFKPESRFNFGKTNIKTNYLNPSFIRRYIQYTVGQPFNNTLIQDLQNNLQQSQYFSYLEVLPKPDRKTKQVKTTIYSHTSKRYHYLLGAGYGSDTGMRGTIGMQVMPLNRKGHTFQIMTKLAQQYSLIDGTYMIPGHNPVNTQYSLFIHLNQYNLPIGNSIASEIGGAINHIYNISKTYALTQITQLYQLNEGSTYTGRKKINQSMMIGSLQFTLGPPISNLGTEHYFQWSIGALAARKAFGSKIDFTQYRTSLNFIRIFKKKWRFVFSNTFAFTQVKNLYNLPISLQLITGGNDSIRGYAYGAIGPGRYLSLGTITLQHRIMNNWFFGTFYDVGAASDGFFKNIKQSVGPTLTRTTPIGGLTFSLAKALSDPSKKGWSFTFTWGANL